MVQMGPCSSELCAALDHFACPSLLFQFQSLWSSIHLLILRARTQLRPWRLEVWSSCHYGNSGAIPSSVSVQFLQPHNTVLHLQCPQMSTALLHWVHWLQKAWNEWRVRTQKQKGGEKRANLCLSPTARLHWYHANSGEACTNPWQHSKGVNP